MPGTSQKLKKSGNMLWEFWALVPIFFGSFLGILKRYAYDFGKQCFGPDEAYDSKFRSGVIPQNKPL